MDSNEHAPKIKPLNHGDLSALLNQAPGRQTSGSTVRSRRSRERAPLKPTDRRRKSSGRDKQFNVNVTPDLFEMVTDMCDRHGLTKPAFTERAFLLFIDTLRKGKGDGVASV
jgi:hypothetical protein